jgi:hypothetical protein
VITNAEDGDNGRDFGWVRRPLRGSGVGIGHERSCEGL